MVKVRNIEVDETLSKKEARIKIADAVNAAQSALTIAQAYADYYGESFGWDLAYGMGGTYFGKGSDQHPNEDCSSSDTDDGWYSSSQSC